MTDDAQPPDVVDDETTDVLIGGYMSKDAAEQDYEAALKDLLEIQ